MRNLTATICLTIAVLLGGPALAETVLYCQSELATGFKKKNGVWKTVKFKEYRWTVKFNKDFSQLFGLDKRKPYLCNWAYDDKSLGTVVCLSSYNNGENFIYNVKKERFLQTRISAGAGYDIDGTDTEALLAGTCKKF